jgi:hypothetical protein
MYHLPTYTATQPTYPQIVVTPINYSQADLADPLTTYINVYKAGDKDNVWSRQRELKFVIESKELQRNFVVECGNIRDKFRKSFPYLDPSMKPYDPGDRIADRYTNFKQIFMKDMPVRTVTTSGGTVNSIYQRNATGTFCGLEIFGEIFLYWKGGINMGYLTRYGGLNAGYFMHTGGLIYSGITVHDENQNPYMQFEFPYNFSASFHFTGQTSPIEMVLSGSTGASVSYYQFKRAGDDFMFMHSTLPLRGHFESQTTSDGSIGSHGLVSYLSA